MLNNYVYSMKNAVKGGKSVSDINVFRLLISSGVCVCVCVCVCVWCGSLYTRKQKRVGNRVCIVL